MRVLLLTALLVAACEFGDNRALVLSTGEPDAAVDREPDAGDVPDAAADLPDGAVETEDCTLVPPQTGCPDGQACDIDDLDTGATACRKVDRDGDARSTCQGERDCGGGFTCVEDATGDASCMRFCRRDADCDAPGGVCDVDLDDGTGAPVPGVTLCTQSCNPVTSNGCPDAWGCQLYTDHTRCRPGGAGGHMASCTGDEDCRVGYGCASVSGSLVCLRNCRVGVLGVCSAISGTTCRSYQTPAIIGGIEYGACL
jgi:hypothetical protein